MTKPMILSNRCSERDIQDPAWVTRWCGWAAKQLRRADVVRVEFYVTNPGDGARPYKIHAEAIDG